MPPHGVILRRMAGALCSDAVRSKLLCAHTGAWASKMPTCAALAADRNRAKPACSTTFATQSLSL